LISRLTLPPLIESSTLLDVITAIQLSTQKLCLIVNGSGRLTGTITDGDVRRALISGLALSSSAFAAMNRHPETILEAELRTKVRDKKFKSANVVVLDGDGRPRGLANSTEISVSHDAPVVLMAGGIGSRLLPLTSKTPKPLIEIGGVPMIEILISRLRTQGFSNIFVAINHLGSQIEERLGVGDNLGVNVRYLKEESALGTAGALGLLSGLVDQPFLVANADLVTTCDFGALLDFHYSSKGSATLGIREYIHQVPFGVVKTSGTRVTGLQEKPLFRGFVSAGIYCFDSSVIDQTLPVGHLDMPDLIGNLIEADWAAVSAFLIHEQWDDVGQISDLERVRSQWGEG